MSESQVNIILKSQIHANNVFNQIETFFQQIQEKFEDNLTTIGQSQGKMLSEILDNINNLIQINRENHIKFKQNNGIHLQETQKENQKTYNVTFIIEDEYKYEKFCDNINISQLYITLLSKYSHQIKQPFVILDQTKKLIEKGLNDKLFSKDNQNYQFFIQPLQTYLNSSLQQNENQLQQNQQENNQFFQNFKQYFMMDQQNNEEEIQRQKKQSQIGKPFSIFNQKQQEQQKQFIQEAQSSIQSRKSNLHDLIKSYHVAGCNDQNQQSKDQFFSAIDISRHTLSRTLIYQCQNCFQRANDQQVSLDCLHTYHEQCLVNFLKDQIDKKQTILVCRCNKKILAKTYKNYLPIEIQQQLFENQLHQIIKTPSQKFIICNRCEFLYISSKVIKEQQQSCQCKNIKEVFLNI